KGMIKTRSFATAELDRFRALQRLSFSILTDEARRLEPGMSERGVARRLVLAALFAGGTPTPAQLRELIATRYPELLESQAGQQREVFANLLRGEGPMLYHCSAGKDRTGLVTALFLAALGVPREIIIADFELSNEYYRADTSSRDTKPTSPHSASN
ncbi:MAG: tyrosine-protein phosphatase, partial [Caulobacteraceae bacterium]